MKLVDTAGIREGSDVVERLGIERTHQAMADADLTLLVFDLSAADTREKIGALLEKFADRKPLLVGNKCDLARRLYGRSDDLLLRSPPSPVKGFRPCSKPSLRHLAPDGLATPESGAITNIRHETLLRESVEALANAQRAVGFGAAARDAAAARFLRLSAANRCHHRRNHSG